MKKRKPVPKIEFRKSAPADPAKAALLMYEKTGDAEKAMAVFRMRGGMAAS